MHHSSSLRLSPSRSSSPFWPDRQLIASVTVAALLAGTWAPYAAAQTAPAAPGTPTAPAEAASPAPADEAPADEAPAEDAPAPLTDEERRDKARASFEAGQKAFDEQSYTVAYEQFKAAYELIPSPHAEYWMATSLDLQGNREAEAARAYQTFLSNPAAVHVGEDKVDEVKRRLGELQAKLPARLAVITNPSGAQITVNGAPQPGVSPLSLELPAGSYRIEATLPNHQPVLAELQLQGGDEVEQRMTLEPEPEPAPAEPAPAPPPPPEREPEERSMLPAYITLGLAGAGLVTGTFFGLKALADKSDFKDDPTTTRADDAERNALIADMAFGIAITLGITGIVLLTSDETEGEMTAKAKKKSSKPSLAVAPVVAPNLGGAAARLTF